MFKKDSTWRGLIIGLILPGIAFLVIEAGQYKFSFMQKEYLPYLVCVAINLLLVRYFFSKDKELISRGIIAITFVCVFLFIFYKMRQ